jgi:hypothetical protein
MKPEDFISNANRTIPLVTAYPLALLKAKQVLNKYFTDNNLFVSSLADAHSKN